MKKHEIAWSGAVDAFGVPSFGLGSSMVGFGAMVQASDLPGWFAVLGSAFIWALPGQVALIEIMAADGPLYLALAAVSFANMRLLPLAVTGVIVLAGGRKLSLFVRSFLVHFMAVTGWVAIMNSRERFAKEDRLYYYMGFAALLFTSGVGCSALGYFGGAFLPPVILIAVVFITPLYLFLLVLSARQKMHIYAVILGSIFGVLFYQVIGDWAIPVVGVGVGSLVFYFHHRSTA